jgi:hypothetical protein
VTSEVVRIGCGSSFENDRLDWPGELADSGLVDFFGFDCLADRTLALQQIRKLADPTDGYDKRIPKVIDRFAKFLRGGGTIVGNFGGANVNAAGQAALKALRTAGLEGVKVGVVRGDDVLEQVRRLNVELPERGCRVQDLGSKIVSANAYLGAEPMLAALHAGARFVLGGRMADPSCWVAPICYELGWELDDWHRVGKATAVAHLLECATQATGGNFEDPPLLVTADPVRLGFPMAEVSDREIIITKLPGTGGEVTPNTLKGQIGYEIHDPASYLTPDVAADFSQVSFAQVGTDRVRVDGITGRKRPDMLKVLVGVDRGWKVDGGITHGGPGCVERAKRCIEVLQGRLASLADSIEEIRYDLIGMNSLFGANIVAGYPVEVRLRVSARVKSKDVAERIMYETMYLAFGPAGGGAAAPGFIVPAIGCTPALLPRSEVDVTWEVLAA